MIRKYEMYSLSLSIIIRNMIQGKTIEEAAEKEFPLIDTEWCRTGACEEENLHLLGHRKSFIKGAKWQQERSISKEAYEDSLNMQRCSNAGYESKINELKSEIKLMYSEEEVYNLLYKLLPDKAELDMWFEQFKKK